MKDYKDNDLCDLLEFGFPIGYMGNDAIWNREILRKIWKHKNHTGATEYVQSMLEYLEKEAENKSI